MNYFLIGARIKGNETILFKTSSEETGLRVIKIEYSLDSYDQFADVISKLTKEYGAPAVRGSSALGSGACAQGTKEQFSYGWGSVHTEDETVVADASGPALVLRGRRFGRAAIILVTITDGPLIQRYLGKEEQKTFQVPSPGDPNAERRKALLGYADSLTAYFEAPSWASQEVAVTPGFSSTSTTTSVREYGRPIHRLFRSINITSVREVQAIHRPIILKPPCPHIEEVEAAIGKSTEHRKGPASTDPICYNWFSAQTKAGQPVLEACFAPTQQDRLVKLTKYSEGNCKDSTTEIIERDSKNWERINQATQ